MDMVRAFTAGPLRLIVSLTQPRASQRHCSAAALTLMDYNRQNMTFFLVFETFRPRLASGVYHSVAGIYFALDLLVSSNTM